MTEVSAEQIEMALKIGFGFNWSGALAAFKGEDTQAKIVNGLILADDVAKIVGLFFPPVAVVANDLGIAIQVEEVAAPFVEWLSKVPPPVLKAGEYSAWGHTFDSTLTQGKF